MTLSGTQKILNLIQLIGMIEQSKLLLQTSLYTYTLSLSRNNNNTHAAVSSFKVFLFFIFRE